MHVSQPVTGGVPRSVIEAAKSQLRRGWSVAVASPRDGILAQEVEAAGARHVEWPAKRSPSPAVLVESLRLGRIVADENPDIVHLHSAKAGLAGRLAVRGGRPTVFQPHGWSFLAVTGATARASLAWESFGARWADRIVCVSQDERVLAETNGIPGHWALIPNAVDLRQHRPATEAERAEIRRRLDLEKTTVVCAGRLSPEKGQATLLEAWQLVLGRVPEAELILVGDGPCRATLDRGSQDNVRFVGERSDVGDWLTAADVVVVPSLWEGMSLVLLEAMARARCVVATDVGGTREALGSDSTAVVPAAEPLALADAIVARLIDEASRSREGQMSRLRVEANHDERKRGDAIALLYEEVLAARDRRRRGSPSAYV